MKKNVVIFVVMFMLSFGSLSWGAEHISLLTCGTAGTWFPMGGAFSRIWSTVPGMNATAETSGCSAVNLRLVNKGEASIGFSNSDAAFFAVKGQNIFDTPFTKIRGMFMMYEDHFHIAALKSSGIRSIADLKGKKVRLGLPATVVVEDSRIILEAYGLKESDVKSQPLSLADAFEQMKDGNIDVVIEPVGYPSAGYIDLAHSRDMVLLDIDKDKLAQINKKYPFLSAGIIPAGTYKGQTKDVSALAVKIMLFTSSDISSETIYKLTKATFQNLNILAESHPKGKLVKLETALADMPITLHPGAERYFREVGVIK
ncbi:MAG: TAXI family TRAP transporter solute-binding subunit [Deltaproteobacteria bacterium]|nr:TAXI family TRAP transporter solute-binding subunit [Deltaproteobacteria bacterium]